MKKVLIIGYGDLGQRISAALPGHQFIGISRSNHVQHKNSEWLQWNWFSGKAFKLKHQEISTVIIILKPTSFDEEGYQLGFLEAANSIMTNLNAQVNYDQLVIVSSTRVYGNSNGQNIKVSYLTPRVLKYCMSCCNIPFTRSWFCNIHIKLTSCNYTKF